MIYKVCVCVCVSPKRKDWKDIYIQQTLVEHLPRARLKPEATAVIQPFRSGLAVLEGGQTSDGAGGYASVSSATAGTRTGCSEVPELAIT